MNCSNCNVEMEPGALYVRGMFTSLLWSTRKDVSFLSKKGLDLIVETLDRLRKAVQRCIKSFEQPPFNR